MTLKNDAVVKQLQKHLQEKLGFVKRHFRIKLYPFLGLKDSINGIYFE